MGAKIIAPKFSTPPTAQASMLLVPTVCQRRNALMKEHAERGHSEDERLEPEMASPLPVPIAPVQSRCSLFSPTALSGRTQALRSAWCLSSIRPSRTSATLVAGAIAALSIPSKRSSPQSPRRSASMVPKIATLLEWNRRGRSDAGLHLRSSKRPVLVLIDRYRPRSLRETCRDMTLVRLAAVAWQVFGPQADQAVMHNHVAHHSIEMRLLPSPEKLPLAGTPAHMRCLHGRK